mmetsp:Transcript_7772/g.26755  ORF Transcript_7772/g.26755 Transcript_7772/m.26755 type:complete len:298 (+) Transcript_7772:544-1437(+)
MAQYASSASPFFLMKKHWGASWLRQTFGQESAMCLATNCSQFIRQGGFLARGWRPLSSATWMSAIRTLSPSSRPTSAAAKPAAEKETLQRRVSSSYLVRSSLAHLWRSLFLCWARQSLLAPSTSSAKREKKSRTQANSQVDARASAPRVGLRWALCRSNVSSSSVGAAGCLTETGSRPCRVTGTALLAPGLPRVSPPVLKRFLSCVGVAADAATTSTSTSTSGSFGESVFEIGSDSSFSSLFPLLGAASALGFGAAARPKKLKRVACFDMMSPPTHTTSLRRSTLRLERGLGSSRAF